MSSVKHEQNHGFTGNGCFATTRWSVVLDAAKASSPQHGEALEELCGAYWHPIYTYLRKRGYDDPDAKDLTQEFFGRLLEKNSLARADRAKGKFRSFLLASVNHFLADQWDKSRAEKRGGRQIFVSWEALNLENARLADLNAQGSADELFDRQWARTVFDRAFVQLRGELAASDKAAHFEMLKRFLAANGNAREYAAVGVTLNMAPASVAMAVHRLRRRCAELVRDEVKQTVASPSEVEDEIRYLLAVMTG